MSSSEADLVQPLQSRPSGALRLTQHAEFGNGGVGLLEYGPEDGPKKYFRFSVYRRTGDRANPRECMALTPQRWEVIADKLCALANEITEKNDLQPEQVVPILMKFHNLDRDYGIHHATRRRITYDRTEEGNYQQLHLLLMQAYRDYRPPNFPPVETNRRTLHRDGSTSTQSRSRSQSPVRKGKGSKKKGNAEPHVVPSRKGSFSSNPSESDAESVADQADLVNAMSIDGCEVLAPTVERDYEYDLLDYQELSYRSQRIQCYNQSQLRIPPCLRQGPNEAYIQSLVETDPSLIIGRGRDRAYKPSLLPVFLKKDQGPATIYWIATYRNTQTNRLEVFLPFQKGSEALVLRDLYLANADGYIDENASLDEKFTAAIEGSAYEAVDTFTTRASVKFEEELSLERSMNFLHQRITEEQDAEAARQVIFDGANAENIGTIFANGNPCLRNLPTWLSRSRTRPLIHYANRFETAQALQVRRKSADVSMELLANRHRMQRMERLQVVSQRNRLEERTYRIMDIVPVQERLSIFLGKWRRAQYKTHYIGLIRETTLDEREKRVISNNITLFLPEHLQGKALTLEGPDGTEVSVLDYLKACHGYPQVAQELPETVIVEGVTEDPLVEIDGTYSAMKVELGNQLREEEIEGVVNPIAGQVLE